MYNAAVLAWLAKNDLAPPDTEPPDWGFRIAMSTAPLDLWIVQRSRVPADTLWFGFSAHRLIGWRAVLQTRDESFKLNWHPTAGLEVRSPSLIHRRRTDWPTFDEIDDLPAVVSASAAIRRKKFLRHARVTGISLNSRDVETFRRWLRPACDILDFRLAQLYGEIPAGADVDDNPEQEGRAVVEYPRGRATRLSPRRRVAAAQEDASSDVTRRDRSASMPCG